MDETYAANRFYDELVKVPNWQSVPVEDAAQSVQRSQYPDRYADWTNLARTWAAGLTGENRRGCCVRAGAGAAFGRGHGWSDQ
ncbi:hypothetical protein BBJK_00024 [Bifidobacterium bifidum LMG 13195]|uniref:Uncharacterized protein n=1 Tax=Bifidobacterium bifidum LMG 13195 TaxID=1207542 RepID=A0A286TA21_BIFBI|nr:hypothetical protein BBJK_00024 [Bifidobacterium bifidum LMG 13195]